MSHEFFVKILSSLVREGPLSSARPQQSQGVPISVPRSHPTSNSLESSRQRDLRECVEGLLEVSWGRRVSLDKRLTQRLPFRKPLTITPVADQSEKPEPSRRFAAFGTEISTTGVGFLARQLVPSRSAVITCDGPDSSLIHLLFHARWVRFTRGGWYQVGGRLMRVLDDTAASVV